jgi:hypothetical protein
MIVMVDGNVRDVMVPQSLYEPDVNSVTDADIVKGPVETGH